MANSYGLMFLVTLFVFTFSITKGVDGSRVNNESFKFICTNKSSSSSTCQTTHGPFYQLLQFEPQNVEYDYTNEYDDESNGDSPSSRFWTTGFGFSSHYETLPVPPPIPAELL